MLKRLFPAGGGKEGFAGKIVLVTGAASGLGRGIALAFARDGAHLALVDIDEDGLSETAAMAESEGSRVLARRVDVSRREEMEGLAEEVLSIYGWVDVLVNNAGVCVAGELVLIPMEDIEWIVGINLMGEIYGARLFLPGMIERGEGHIVNVSSISGLALLPFNIAYTTTKFGITGFTTALWAECRRHGVGVTLVCPGAVSTNIAEHTRLHTTSIGQRNSAERYKRLLRERGMDIEEAGRRVLEAVAADRFLLLLGFEAYLIYYLTRLFPGLMRRVTALVNAAVSRK